MSEHAAPEKDTFVRVIVACAVRHSYNGRAAFKALSEEQNYPLNAAALAILLALIYLDAGIQTSQMLCGDDDDLVDLFALLADPAVLSVIGMWAKESFNESNSVAALVRFGIGYGAFSAVSALLADPRVAEHVSLALYRTAMSGLANALRNIEQKQRENDATLVYVSEEKMARVIDSLSDGGQRVANDAVHIMSLYAERAQHNSTSDSAPTVERERIAAEIMRDRCRARVAKLQRTGAEIYRCLERIQNDALDLLGNAILVQQARKQGKVDPDEDTDDKLVPAVFDAADAYRQVERDVEEYNAEKNVHDPAVVCPDVLQQASSHVWAIEALRKHGKSVKAVEWHAISHLIRLETASLDAVQEAQVVQFETLKHDIETIDVDQYLQ